MFSLHETTRKRTCRTAFFALCLAPTCATAAWIADHHLPWRAAAAARWLSDRYHLDVAISDWREPRPSLLRSASATITDPQTAAPLLKLTGVETRRGDVLILSIDELALRVADLPALAERLEWSLQRADARRIDLHVKQVTLNASVITQLHQLRATIERDPRGKLRLRMLAHTSATPAAEAKPIGLSLETVASSKEAGVEHDVVTLDAQQNAIPVALLAPLVPGAAAFNEVAVFNGIVTWQRLHAASGAAAPPTWEGALRGRLAGVDLATLIPRSSSHKLHGSGTIELTDCRWQGTRFTRLAGTLTAAPGGQLNGAFLFAARTFLGCSVGADFKEVQAAADRSASRQPAEGDEALAAELYRLDRFACRFELDAAGIVIAAHPSDEEAATPATNAVVIHAIAESNGQPLLLPAWRPNGESGETSPIPLPAASWLQFMANWTPGWLPFTPEAVETARRLPTSQ